MGDGQHGALVTVQILLQPFGGPEIQVVGGLVQQEDVGILQNQAGQVDPGLLPAGEGGKSCPRMSWEISRPLHTLFSSVWVS